MTIVEFLNARLDDREQELLPLLNSPRRNGKTHVRRELADVAAKRAIIRRYENASRHADDGGEDEAVRSEWVVIASTYEQALCEHASVYADHSDYQQEWKP